MTVGKAYHVKCALIPATTFSKFVPRATTSTWDAASGTLTAKDRDFCSFSGQKTVLLYDEAIESLRKMVAQVRELPKLQYPFNASPYLLIGVLQERRKVTGSAAGSCESRRRVKGRRV